MIYYMYKAESTNRAYLIPYCVHDGKINVLVKAIKETPKNSSDHKNYYTYSLLGGTSGRGQHPEDTAARETREETLSVLDIPDAEYEKLELVHFYKSKKGISRWYYSYKVDCSTYEVEYIQRKTTAYLAQQEQLKQNPGMKIDKHYYNEVDFIIWVPLEHLLSLHDVESNYFKWSFKGTSAIEAIEEKYNQFNRERGIEMLWPMDRFPLQEFHKLV